jgi:hypothetical protein
MRAIVWGMLALLCLVTFAPEASAQRRKLDALETRLSNMQTDLEVLQEFIQEQSTGLTNLKQKTAELEKLKTQIGAVDGQVKGLNALVAKNVDAIDTLGQKVATEEKRLTVMAEELKRKKVDFSGQLRIRPEFKMNQRYFNNLLDEDQNFMASHRARISLDVRPASWLAARVTLQDARHWGSPTLFSQSDDIGPVVDIAGNSRALPEDANRDSAMRVHEAFLDVEVAKDLVNVKAGRQIWNFGKGRMVGNNDWEQAGRSFDGLDLTVSYKNFVKADLLFSWIDERNALGGSDVLFGGAYVTVPYVKDLDIDAYFLYLGDNRDNAKRNVGTIGARVGGLFPWHEALFFDLEGALQFGTVTEQGATDNATIDNSHYAVFLHADVGYAIPVQTTPTISLFYELASGDGNTSPADPANDQSVSWIPLFPTRHGLFGPMDIWRQSNIWDLGGRLEVTPVKGLKVVAQIHSLHLYEGSGAFPWGGERSASFLQAVDTGLGTEFDLCARYQLSDNLGLASGYGVFAPGAAFGDLDELDPIVLADPETGEPFRYPRGDAAHWFFMQADFTF